MHDKWAPDDLREGSPTYLASFPFGPLQLEVGACHTQAASKYCVQITQRLSGHLPE